MGIMRRINAAWRALTGARPPAVEAPPETDESDAEELPALRRDLASANLELQEVRGELDAERARRSALENAQSGLVSDGVESELGELFERLAAPLSQLRMQQHMLDSGKPVGGDDVMAVAAGLAAAVEEAGLEPVGAVGHTISFDPETSQPLSPDAEIDEGEECVVKLCGYRYGGRVIRKAFVEEE